MDKMLSRLQQLMNCHAFTKNIDGVNQAVDLMAGFAEEEGLFVHRETLADGRKSIHVATVDSKATDVLLNAHLDVVPVSDDALYTLRREENVVYGRGPHDDQGSALCIFDVLSAMKGKGSFGAFFSSDEEKGGVSTLEMVKRGYVASKLAIVIDGADYAVTVAQKGILNLMLTARGIPGHSSIPWAFSNAFDALVDGYVKLRSNWILPAVSETDQWFDTYAATIASAGTPEIFNQIPGQASLVLNIRYTQPGGEEEIIQRIKTITGLDVTRCGDCCPPFVSDCNHPYMQDLLKKISTAFPDHKCKIARMNGATDARHLASMNIPIAILGIPGDGAHTDNEYLELDGYAGYRQLLIQFLKDNF